MELFLQIISESFTWGLLLGLLLVATTWRLMRKDIKQLRVEKQRLETEGKELQGHLNTQLKINSKGNEKLEVELNELREAMALFGQERERLIASHAKQRAEWVRKEKLVHDVQQLRQEVESLSLGDDEREELRELREAVTLFGEERERLLADHAEQRAEWERCLTEATHEATFLARTRGAAGEDELLSILEQERKSFWETMEDTNEKLAFLELEHSKVVQENMELRSKLSQHEDDTESSVKKIRAILKNRREFTDSPISLPKSPGSPGSPSADFSSVVASLASRRESPSPKRITVKRTGSVYIS